MPDTDDAPPFCLTPSVVDHLITLANATGKVLHAKLAETFVDNTEDAYAFTVAYLLAVQLCTEKNKQVAVENINGLFRIAGADMALVRMPSE